MEQAKRNNKGKLQWSLVDFDSFQDMVRVLEHGAEKYGRDNWKKGLPTNEICESLLRHIFAYMGGEKTDTESGLSHIGHIQANAMFLGYMERKEEHEKIQRVIDELIPIGLKIEQDHIIENIKSKKNRSIKDLMVIVEMFGLTPEEVTELNTVMRV